MSDYLLDSDGLISYEHRVPYVLDRFDELRLQGHVLGSCAITIAEFYAGRIRGADTAIDAFIDFLRYWHISRADALQAGRWRYTYARQGLQLSTTDTLLAALAVRLGATILTENVKDFPMPDVAVESLLR